MRKNISKIGPHVYVKESVEAVKLYKSAFELEDKGAPVMDAEGDIYYHTLTKNDDFFVGVSEDKYLQAAIKKGNIDNARPTMVFTVAFESEDDIRKAFNLLYEDGNPSTGLIAEPGATIYCDLVDKFGVCWCLFVPLNWDDRVVPK